MKPDELEFRLVTSLNRIRFVVIQARQESRLRCRCTKTEADRPPNERGRGVSTDGRWK